MSTFWIIFLCSLGVVGLIILFIKIGILSVIGELLEGIVDIFSGIGH